MVKVIQKIKLYIYSIVVCLVVGLAVARIYPDIDAKFVSNYDADTITVDVNDWPAIIGEHISVRINGIDTPEIKGGNEKTKALAKEAKEFVNILLSGCSSITLKNPQRGKYFRIVADIEFNGLDLGTILKAFNFAVEYKGDGPRPDWTKILIDDPNVIN